MPPDPGRGIALALSGGAALGWAHLGALRELEAAGVPVAAVAGTSIGALAAICLAAGKLDALEAIARGATRRRMLGYLDPSLRRGAWLGGRRIARELDHHLGALRFEALAIPAAVIAADLDTGAEVRITSGPVTDAIAASMALPGIFHPVAREGRLLIDGGMVMNLPIAAARALAPHRPVVVFDLMGDYRGHVRTLAGRPRSAAATMRSAFLMMIQAQAQMAIMAEAPALTIAMPIGHLRTADFHQANELIALGRAAARRHLAELERLAAA